MHMVYPACLAAARASGPEQKTFGRQDVKILGQGAKGLFLDFEAPCF